MTDSHEIKEKVKERYAKVAFTGDSCCGPLSMVKAERDVVLEMTM